MGVRETRVKPASSEALHWVVGSFFVHDVVVSWDGVSAAASVHAGCVCSDLLGTQVNRSKPGQNPLALDGFRSAECPTRPALPL